jgi:heme oxygenase
MSFVDHLKEDIASTHTAIEKTPFAIGMVSGRIDRDTYCNGLAQLGFLHEALESLLSRNPIFQGIYVPADMDRAEIADRDLAVLGYEGIAIPNEATGRMTDQLFAWSSESPWSLIGTLYVLEGSRMGSMYLARSLSKAFGVEPRPGVGLDYHVEGMATRPKVWQRFKATLAELALTEGEQNDVRRGAVESMTMLCEMYAALPSCLAVPASV